MKSLKFFVLAACAALSLCSCKGGSQQAPVADNKFVLPDVPAVITQQQEAIDYIVKHYWDAFFADERPGVRDTSLIAGFTEEVFSEAFYSYAILLRGVDKDKAFASCAVMLDKLEKAQMANPEGTLWKKFTDVYSLMLKDVNSTVRNEEYCIPLLQKIAASPVASEEEKAAAEADLPRFCLNRLGQPAADFEFTLQNGRPASLYGIDSEYTIIFFSNPGCPNCREVMDALKQLPGIDELIASKRLAVANIYPDEDLGEWIKYAPIYPRNWLNGYDHLLRINGVPLYNIRAIPSVYLLDKDKKVIMKDAPTEYLVDTLYLIFGLDHAN